MRCSLLMQSWLNTTPLTIAALDKYGKSWTPYAVDAITSFMTVFGWFRPSVLQCSPVQDDLLCSSLQCYCQDVPFHSLSYLIVILSYHTIWLHQGLNPGPVDTWP